MDNRPSPTPNGNSHRPSRWLIVLAGTVTVATVGALALRPAGHRVDASPAAAPSSTASAVSPGPAARPVPAEASALIQIADHLVAAPYETQQGAHDGIEYIDVRMWTTTDAAGKPAHARRIRYWTTASGTTGRWYIVDETRGCPADDNHWTNQREPTVWGGPLSGDPDAVRRQLLGPGRPDGIDLIAQIGELYLERIVPLRTRRGLLLMLARLPHLAVQADVRDAAGRPGIAVTDTAGPATPEPGPPSRRTVIIDPVTGDLLATIQTAVTGTATPDYTAPPGTHSAALGYALYLTRRYVPTVHTPAPDCRLTTTSTTATPRERTSAT